PTATPLVHLAMTQRAEIVIFGRVPYLMPPFTISAGSEFTLTAAHEDDRCTVGRFTLNPPDIRRRQCSLKLEDVLRTMAEMGGQYPDAVELLRQADARKCVSSIVQADATPRVVSVEELAHEGKEPRY